MAENKSGGGDVYKDKSKPMMVRMSNISAAKGNFCVALPWKRAECKSVLAVADAIRTSLGPKGMDKMIQSANGEVNITNDGATILDLMEVLHPAAKMVRAIA